MQIYATSTMNVFPFFPLAYPSFSLPFLPFTFPSSLSSFLSLLPSFLIDCSASRDHVLHHVVLPVHVPVHEDLETPPLPVHPGQVARRDLYSLKLSYLFNRIPIWMCRRWLYQVSCYSPSAAHCSRPLKGQVLQRVSYLCMVSCFITSFSLL